MRLIPGPMGRSYCIQASVAFPAASNATSPMPATSSIVVGIVL